VLQMVYMFLRTCYGRVADARSTLELRRGVTVIQLPYKDLRASLRQEPSHELRLRTAPHLLCVRGYLIKWTSYINVRCKIFSESF
jgi:hypothetical protein